ncbi:YunG family protein [Priestia koreensis]|uniref:YunG family protein n=1 Tax=Priestia koreensis TaxID=284581 RepID=UPI00203C1A2B|nr:hypothetical protein [Priestia koreensis]MCM3005313.1 hypothetical protein [Priestia koreensis]
MNMQQQIKVYEILYQVWSKESSSKWTKENPANGQCGVTSLVVQDLFGGDIYKTDVKGSWHFYNMIEGKRYDFTASQFLELPLYEDQPSSRNEAFEDTNHEQYTYLKEQVMQFL